MRRLPVYLIADTSGSMSGEPIQQAWRLFGDIISLLRQDPFSLETAIVSVITYSKFVEMTPFCGIDTFVMPELPIISSGPKNCGLALERLLDSYQKNIRETSIKQKGDWRSIVILATIGSPSDVRDYSNAVKKLKALNKHSIFVFHGNEKKTDSYKSLAEEIFPLYSYDLYSLKKIFGYTWMEDTIEVDSISISSELPPPPSEVNIII